MICMLNCSYKGKSSNSRYFLGLLEKELGKFSEQKCVEMDLKQILTTGFEDFLKKMEEMDALVIGAPLYVDGLPAQVVKLLEMLIAKARGQFPNLKVYVVSNLGFYEAEQIRHLFSIVENWCIKMGLKYGGGVAVGAGPMVRIVKEKLPWINLNKQTDDGIKKLAEAVSKGEIISNQYCKTIIPRWVYLMAAHNMFRKEIKKNTYCSNEYSHC